MAGDNFSWDIVVRLATQGAKSAKGDIEGFSTAVDEMSRTGKVSEKVSEQAARATIQQGRAAKSASADVKQMETSVISLRYANYDLATSMFAVSAGITAAGAASLVAFGSQERAFTEVERIVGGSVEEIEGLRESLMALSTEIPRSFQDLSAVASLGAALDIPAASLDEFTSVVARFASVTGVTEEAAATGFARIAQYMGLTADQYEALGSAILKAGNVSIATEEQVLKFAQALAPAADRVGFTTEQVVSLGAAIASYGNINVEGAGSALSRLTSIIERAVSEGGSKLDAFAASAGLSAEQFRIAWATDASGTFNSMLAGLSTVDNLTTALDSLGIVNERDRRVVAGLAQNFDKFNGILGRTTSAWREGTYMSESYGLVLDDLNSKWMIFINAVTNAAAAVGSTIAPAMKQLLDGATQVLVAFASFANSEIGQRFIQMAGILLTLVAAYAALRGGIALASASLQAFSIISGALNGAGIAAGLRGLASAFGMVTGSATTAAAVTGHAIPASFGAATVASSRLATGLRIAGTAFLALGRATIIIGVLQAAAALIFDFGGSMQWLAGVATEVTSFIGYRLADVAGYIASVAQALSSIVPGLSGVARSFAAFSALTRIHAAAGTVTKDFTNWAASLKTASDGMDDLGSSADLPYQDYTEGTGDWADSLNDVGDGADNATREVRTLADYASDLQSVFSRAFELRFSGGSTLDAITSTFLDIREATEESARNIQKLKAEIQGLQSDLSIQQYFLSIAVEYGDTARAAAIQANIAKLQADLTDKTADLSDEQDKNSKTLTGNSKAAIANRKQMEDLVKQYQEHITALASSGLSQADLAKRTAELKEQFIQQATQLGYNRGEVERYAQAFDDMRVIIERLPRNITVNFNGDAALQAINEFKAKAQTALSGGVSMPVTSSFDDQGTRKLARAAEIQTKMQDAINEMIRAAGRGDYPASAIWSGAARNYANILKSGNYYTGGFTGQGGKYEPAGVVHRGEYVVPKKDVNQRTGLPYADAMGRLTRGASGPGYAGGGFVRGPGNAMGMGHIASFGPMAMQQQAQLFAEYMKVYLDGRTVADNSARQYAHGTATGAA